MLRGKIAKAAALAGAVASLLTAAASAQTEQSASATPSPRAPRIALYDYTGTAAPVLDRATARVARIFESAGLNVAAAWCRAAMVTTRCGGSSAEQRLVVRLVRATALTPVSLDGTLGMAFLDSDGGKGDLASVYVDRVAALALRARFDFAELLAETIAHEAGHLLLATTQHSRRGIMRPEISAMELRIPFEQDARFSASDAARLRVRWLGEQPAVQLAGGREISGAESAATAALFSEFAPAAPPALRAAPCVCSQTRNWFSDTGSEWSFTQASLLGGTPVSELGQPHSSPVSRLARNLPRCDP